MAQSNIGKTCPFCQFPLKADSEVVKCPACKVPHHRECWQENGSCTTFGCRETSCQPAAKLQMLQPEAVSASFHSAISSERSDEPNQIKGQAVSFGQSGFSLVDKRAKELQHKRKLTEPVKDVSIMLQRCVKAMLRVFLLIFIAVLGSAIFMGVYIYLSIYFF